MTNTHGRFHKNRLLRLVSAFNRRTTKATTTMGKKLHVFWLHTLYTLVPSLHRFFAFYYVKLCKTNNKKCCKSLSCFSFRFDSLFLYLCLALASSENVKTFDMNWNSQYIRIYCVASNRFAYIRFFLFSHSFSRKAFTILKTKIVRNFCLPTFLSVFHCWMPSVYLFCCWFAFGYDMTYNQRRYRCNQYKQKFTQKYCFFSLSFSFCSLSLDIHL